MPHSSVSLFSLCHFVNISLFYQPFLANALHSLSSFYFPSSSHACKCNGCQRIHIGLSLQVESVYTNIHFTLPFLPLSPSTPFPSFLFFSVSLFLLSLQSWNKNTHHAFAPCQQRKVPGGEDPSQWQRLSAAASRTAMCSSVSAFGDDLVSQSLMQPIWGQGDPTEQTAIILPYKKKRTW